MKKYNVKTAFVSAVLLSFAALPAFAGDAPDSTFPKPQKVEGTTRPTVGVLGGYADQNAQIKPGIAYGVNAAFQPIVPIGLGLEVTRFQAGADVPAGVDFSFYRTSLFLTGDYNLGGTVPVIRETYIGLKVGAVFDKFTVNSVDQTDTRFAFAPEIGMDFMLCQGWSVGPQISYTFTVGPEKNYDTFLALANVKYWF